MKKPREGLSTLPTPFDYAAYEEQCRDRQWNRELLTEYVPYFTKCQRVLDLACGPGLFLELLEEHGVACVGVERNSAIAEQARGQGREIITQDVFTFLTEEEAIYDGVFCSHFIEHLPFEQVLRLIELIVPRLASEGTLVLVFPNPESMRMQLFGFWRDPEHVRFYHPELIEAVCTHYGLTIVHSNRFTEPFSLSPLFPVGGAETGSGQETVEKFCGQEAARKSLLREMLRFWYSRILQTLRLVSKSELALELSALESRLRQEQEATGQEVRRWAEKTTWAINRMWSWPDSAVLVFQKGPVDSMPGQKTKI